MREMRTGLQAIGIMSLLVLFMLPACGWRRMAVERHQQTQRIKELDIERRELELKCLRRKEADPRVDCSQFQQSAAPIPATAPPPSATSASPAATIPTPVPPTPAPPAQ
jgi:hypothetical protein